MNLLATEQITWTVPVSAQARRLYREWKSLVGDDQVTSERRDELAARMKPVNQFRLTLASVTMTEEAKRENVLQGVREWFEQEHGIGPAQFNRWYLDKHIRKADKNTVEYERGEGLSVDEATAIFGIVRDIADWATLIVCLKTVETRQAPMVGDDSGFAWKQVAIPSEWKDYHKFREVFPRRLFLECLTICNDLNPGVWGVAMDEDSKNVGGVSVIL